MNKGKRARRTAAAARRKSNDQRRETNGPRVNRLGKGGGKHRSTRAQGKKNGHKGWGVVGESEMAHYFQTIWDDEEEQRNAQFEREVCERFDRWVAKCCACGRFAPRLARAHT